MSDTDTMTAVTHERYGEADVLRTARVPVPSPARGEVLIRVAAAALNPADVFLMRGRPALVRPMLGFTRPRPGARVRGSDAAGTVVAVGDDVTDWEVGDEVFGEARGSLAEYAVARADRIAAVPARVAPEHAAASVMAGLTALHGLRQREVSKGDRVLIIGASGGIGSFAVQLAARAGAHVTGVCSTRNVDAVRGLGCAAVVDYTQERVSDLGGRFDLILDNVGSTPMLALERMTTPTGLVVPNSGAPGPDGGALARVVKANWHRAVRRKRIGTFLSTPNRDDLDLIARLLADGEVTPLVDTMFTLDHAVDAMARVASRHARGKVVVSCR